MKVTFTKEALLKGVQTIQATLSARTTLPILHNFLMETDDSRVKIVSTDLEMGVRCYLPTEVITPGSITIPAKKLSDIIHSLPEGKDIDLFVDSNNKVHIKSGKARFWVTGSPKSEYPVIPEFIKEGAFEIPALTLAEMIKKTIFAVSTDETRYVLNGLLWKAEGGTLRMVATDGRRLASVVEKGIPKDKKFKVIVPTKVLQEFIRLAGADEVDEQEQATVSVQENQISFQFDDKVLVSRLVEGSFPNYEQVIPSKKDIQVKIKCDDLLGITKRASLCTAERGGAVKYQFKEGLLHVTASSQNIEFEDEIDINYHGKPFIISFNPLFIIDFLKNNRLAEVVCSLTTPLNPALLEPVDDDRVQYVVMPLRS
ncbi:MAG: DNA polymerase III subunit beta [Elusimicrobia bacterium RIFCSPLOWO2_12_FULL_59_9]|nr:MAG: DNA polymerase III subunit beta [Elusimicrobia bacterium RIFCSPLOWO2_12_FULL_59_9]